jgi:hypothetical protein
MAARLGPSGEEVLNLYAGLYQPGLSENRELLGDAGSGLHRSARKLVRLMRERRMIHREPRIGALFDGHWLPGGR